MDLRMCIYTKKYMDNRLVSHTFNSFAISKKEENSNYNQDNEVSS